MLNNLIVPVAADKSEWKQTIPYMFDLHPMGNLMLYESISGLNLQQFGRIYVTVLAEHARQHGLETLLHQQFQAAGLSEKLEIVMLDNPTRNQPETVAATIKNRQIQGPVLIKDADNRFECDPVPSNTLGIFPLDALARVNPADKSYVSLDDSMYVTNIIEKKIIGRYFCTGAYGFETADLFLQYYDSLARHDRLYISHIIYAMLLDKISFRPFVVKNYVDWGTKKEWLAYCAGFKTLFIPWKILQTKNQKKIISKINALYASEKNKIVLVLENNFLQQGSMEQSIKDSGILFHEIVIESYPHDMRMITKANELFEIE